MPSVGELINAISIHLLQKHEPLRILENIDFDKELTKEENTEWNTFVDMFTDIFNDLMKDFCSSVSINIYDDYNGDKVSKNNLDISITFDEEKVYKNGIVLSSVFTAASRIIECNNHKCDECRRLDLACGKICAAMNLIERFTCKWHIERNLTYRPIDKIVEFITMTNMTMSE
jgi:hypothetical protein